MIRNFVLKLPNFKCTSDYAFSSSFRKRNFRSLSPVQRVRTSLDTERSLSCSRVESGHLVDTHKSRARTLCFSKSYYVDQNHDEKIKEIQWREDPGRKKEVTEEKVEQNKPIQFETLEQYELEAAKPRAAKSRNVINALTAPRNSRFDHLQPSQIKPYGSQANVYAPSLMRPTSLLKYPRKFKKIGKEPSQDHVSRKNSDIEDSACRKYSTCVDTRELSTSKSYVSKNTPFSKEYFACKKNSSKAQKSLESAIAPSSTRKIKELPIFKTYKEPWAEPKQKFDFKPPRFQSEFDMEDENRLLNQFSTPEMRKVRREKENQNNSLYYKASYSDLVKLKLKEREDIKIELLAPTPTDSKAVTQNCLGRLVKNPEKSSQMLQAKKSFSDRRSLTTRSKSNLLSKELSSAVCEANVGNTLLARKSIDDSQEQRNYSKSKSKTKKEQNANNSERAYNPKCENICTPFYKHQNKRKESYIPYEPKPCEGKVVKKIYLPTHVKLSPPPCTPRPEYRDCKKVEPCHPRADDCLIIGPRKLPKLPLADCPCIEEPRPTVAPKLEKLHFKFDDPPRVICHPPPCQTPRSDDNNPHKFKPLRPYVPGECECIEPPPMKDVRLKRLPKCTPEEVCRPPRICPVIEKCPPRADACLKIVPKPLPPICPSLCPCIDPPMPKLAPPIKRLNLTVPEPPKICRRPPPCALKERADDHMKPKKKKLPKFVPGDCPCEDRPMVDWRLKRLVCEDEPEECIVPDPCKAFPRADWGCWEYEDEICETVDEKCIDNRNKCPPPEPSRGHLCDRHDLCEKAGKPSVRKTSKRRYSNSSSSLRLYQQVKTQDKAEDKGIKTTANSYKPPEIMKSPKSKTEEKTKSGKKVNSNSAKMKSKSAVSLIRLLKDLDRSEKDNDEQLLFKPIKNEKVNYECILEKIASSAAVVDKKQAKVGALVANLDKPKSIALKITSRAISTTKSADKDEKDMKRDKDCEAKEKCKNIKPSIKSLMCRKACPSVSICDKGGEKRRGCKVERIPVCCQKEESPYPAFTDNLEESMTPYTKTPQWTCNRMQYGYHPNFKKEFEPLQKSKKKNKKNFSTSSVNSARTMSNSHPIETISRPITATGARSISNTTSRTATKAPSKAFLKKSLNQNVILNQTRAMSSIIFEIKPPVTGNKPKPNKNCPNRVTHKEKDHKITCTPPDDKCEPHPRRCCTRDYTDPNCKRKPPPFPAFSDCLDEEMEDILTECPLDKEKYLRMQPRFMNPTKKPFTLNPPPPYQGKIDLLKEQECIRDKISGKNEGITQTCSDFGKPVPLMRSRKVIKEEANKDCERMEELKKIGRWPPFTLKQNRHLCTSTSIVLGESYRNLSTLGLNSIPEISGDSLNPPTARRIYIRNYHALVRSTDKAVLADNESKLKELTQKIFPDMDESTKLLKLRNKQWRIQNPKNYELMTRPNNVAKRIRRFYTTYKTKQKIFLRRLGRGYTVKTHIIRRGSSSKTHFLKYNNHNLKENRSLKSSRHNHDVRKGRYQIQSNKKLCSKFTLNDCPPKKCRKACDKEPFRKDSAKPFSPYPSFSESKDHELDPRACECARPAHTTDKLQPRYSILTERQAPIQQFPSQEKIDRSLGFEYYRCKHGLKNEGTTLDCETFGFCDRKENSEDCRTIPCETDTKYSSKSDVVEVLVQDHMKPVSYEEATSCCSQSTTKVRKNQDDCEEDRKKLEEICMEHCLKCIPCHLPEEDKICVCKAECKKVFENIEQPGCNLPEESCACKETTKIIEPSTSEQKHCKEERVLKPKILKSKDCDEVIKKHSKIVRPLEEKCKKIKWDCPPKTCNAVVLQSPPCPPKKSKSLTQLENIWQKIVNYFRARPNCPAPGDWKRIALKEKAEKAATAAGLITLDPKCLPPGILRTAKAPKKECKVCPNKDPCEKRDAESDSNKSASPKLPRRNYSTIVQPSRNFSRSISCQNLKEINRLLEEAEFENRKLKYRRSNPNIRKDYGIFPFRKDAETSEAVRMSLDRQLNKYVDLRNLCYKGPNSRTYFGYSNVIPSRENILERAWRLTIESYNKCNCPRTQNFFNEFFKKIETSIQSVEDLEKLKTENVLRELDEFLKNHDSDKDKE